MNWDISKVLDAVGVERIKSAGGTDWTGIVHNPFFIGVVIAVLIISILKRTYRLLALLFCAGASWCAYNYVLSPDKTGINPQNIASFLGVFILIMIVAVYFLFIRSE
ncbi:MAG: hypothetical protein V1736_13155 [Pseudomonadota bacterium]